MCGIAGYSLTASSPLERTLAAQALLAGIAERGADAVGYAHRTPGEGVSVPKQRSSATAWIDERRENSISVARGVGRPVWLGAGDDGVFFASTKLGLEVVERFLGVKLEMDELEEGTLVQLELGRETSRTRFNPDRRFEDAPLPAVRAPREA